MCVHGRADSKGGTSRMALKVHESPHILRLSDMGLTHHVTAYLSLPPRLNPGIPGSDREGMDESPDEPRQPIGETIKCGMCQQRVPVTQSRTVSGRPLC